MDLNLIFNLVLGLAVLSVAVLIVYSIITNRLPKSFVVNAVSFSIATIGCKIAHGVFINNLEVSEKTTSVIIGLFLLLGIIGFIKTSLYQIKENNDPML